MVLKPQATYFDFIKKKKKSLPRRVLTRLYFARFLFNEEEARKIRCWFIMGCVSKFQGESYENWAFLAGLDFCGDYEEGFPLIYTLRTPSFPNREII